MSIKSPQQLVVEFKKSGEFDRLRKELLLQFKSGDSINSMLPRVQDIIRQKLDKDKNLLHLSPDAIYGELMQEMERYPIVERAVAEFPPLHNPNSELRKSIYQTLERLLESTTHKRDSTSIAVENGATEAGIEEDMQQSDEDNATAISKP